MNAENIVVVTDYTYRKFSWLISIAVNAVILICVLHFTDLMYETNDDFAIAQKIVAGYPYIGFVNYYLCKVLIVIQRVLPNTNIFILSQIVVSFVAFTAMLKVVIERNRHLTEIILATAVLAIFSADHYSSIQFTKTSALLMTVGLVLTVDAYINRRDRKLLFVLYAGFGLLMFSVGVAYRQKGMFPALGFAGAFLLIWLMLNGRAYFRGKKAICEILLITIIIGCAGFPYWLDLRSDAMNSRTPELAAGREYQAERVKITDYPMMENYEGLKSQYDTEGLSENDLYLIDRWIFDYDGAASFERLKKINEINYPKVAADRSFFKAGKSFLKGIYDAVLEMNSTGMHIIILIVLAMYIVSAVKPKYWLYVLLAGCMAVCVYCAVYYMGRPQYRAFYVADIGAAFWLIYILSNINERNTRTVRIVSCIVAACLVLSLSVPTAKGLREQLDHNAKQIESERVTEYFASHQGSFYIGPTTVMKQPAEYMDPMKVSIPAANVSGTGGWETKTPYKMDFLAKYGISNPIRDLIDNPNAYYYSDSKQKQLKEYYEKWYCAEGEEISFEKVDEVDGNNIYRVVRTNK